MSGDFLPESDSELELQARAQADAIARSEALALEEARQAGLPGVFHALGRALRVSRDQVSAGINVVQKPGRELLVWQMRQLPDLAAAWPLAFELMQEPRFVASVPAGRDLPLFEFKAQRQWAQAVAEWNALGGGSAETWIRCDRQLLLRRDGGKVGLTLSYRDVCVRFDQAAGALAPHKVEASEKIGPGGLAQVQGKLPGFGALDLAEGLRAPGRALLTRPKRGAADAYVKGHNLLPNLEVFLQDKRAKKKDEAQDAGRGFLTWLSGLVKNSGGPR